MAGELTASTLATQEWELVSCSPVVVSEFGQSLTGFQSLVLPKSRTTINCSPISTKKLHLLSAIVYLTVIVWVIFAIYTEGQTSIIVCPSKIVYHISCPGCGVTRATILLFRGEVISALSLNPNVIFSFLFITLYPLVLIAELVLRKDLMLVIYDYLDSCLKKTILFWGLLEVIIWIHNILNDI